MATLDYAFYSRADDLARQRVVRLAGPRWDGRQPDDYCREPAGRSGGQPYETDGRERDDQRSPNNARRQIHPGAAGSCYSDPEPR